ncbi:MAG: L,D-transpeptidase family protein, partial [Cytophagales bacterium]|nr:L,D-transpeptidase family protein [Cytophaga sp.]
KTLNALNFTIPQLRNTVLANLERCRWLLHDLPDEYIWVNIADYTLVHVKNNKEIYKEAVIVGQEVHQTPVFEASMTYIEFNPYWTVPASIATKEILPQLQKNPDYLEKHNMQLFANNEPVATPSSFSSYSETYFPYTIKQEPGEKNSLGKVKFMFPNPYSIYMHDTPAQNLFDKDQRSFSHGCIRLHNPVDFAYHLLSPQGFSVKQISDKVYSEKNEIISLEKKIPVMIVYFTCYSKQGDKRMFFVKDIYGNDQKIVQLLLSK